MNSVGIVGQAAVLLCDCSEEIADAYMLACKGGEDMNRAVRIMELVNDRLISLREDMSSKGKELFYTVKYVRVAYEFCRMVAHKQKEGAYDFLFSCDAAVSAKAVQFIQEMTEGRISSTTGAYIDKMFERLLNDVVSDSYKHTYIEYNCFDSEYAEIALKYMDEDQAWKNVRYIHRIKKSLEVLDSVLNKSEDALVRLNEYIKCRLVVKDSGAISNLLVLNEIMMDKCSDMVGCCEYRG